ncbi:MAG: universal stress protein [Chlorobi bacterium]|nr:universal stress protein [Chlorobiota bacterium]
MIKRILVPLDPSPYSDSAIEFAIAMAKRHGSELTGLVILDLPGIEKSIGAIPLGASYYADHLEKSKKSEAKERIDKLIKKFSEKCKAAGVKYRAANRQGSPSDWIVKESIYYDLIIIGLRTYFHFETQDDKGDSLEKLMQDSITPIYAVPKNIKIPDINKTKLKALLAFDGSLPAARALQRFAHLAIPEVSPVIILNSSENKDEADYLLTEAENYLHSHNFTDISKVWTDEPIVDYIDKHYINEVYAFVVGSHSRKGGMLDYFVGSLTKHLIKNGNKPLLIG